MNILAIDSSVGVSVAVLSSSGNLTSSELVSHGMQGELTADFISQTISSAGLTVSDITDVVVGVGPGPFTGLRVGIVTAVVFAHARGIPVHGICSLDAVAYKHGKPCVVVTDARRKELYWAQYDNGRTSQPQVAKPDALADMFKGADFVGPGVELYPEWVTGTNLDLHASALAEIFASGTAQLVDVAPMYLRKPDAVEPTSRKSVL